MPPGRVGTILALPKEFAIPGRPPPSTERSFGSRPNSLTRSTRAAGRRFFSRAAGLAATPTKRPTSTFGWSVNGGETGS